MTLDELRAQKAEVESDTSLSADERQVKLRRLRKKIRELGGGPRQNMQHDEDSNVTSEGSQKPQKARKAARAVYSKGPTFSLPEMITALANSDLEEKEKTFIKDKLAYGIVVFPGTSPDDLLQKFESRWPGNVAQWFTVLQQTESSYTIALGPVPLEVASTGGR